MQNPSRSAQHESRADLHQERSKHRSRHRQRSDVVGFSGKMVFLFRPVQPQRLGTDHPGAILVRAGSADSAFQLLFNDSDHD